MNWMRFKPFYFLLSVVALSLSAYSIFAWGFKPSIDFTGGSIAEYKFTKNPDRKIVSDLAKKEIGEEKLKEIKKSQDMNLELKFTSEVTQNNAKIFAERMSQQTNDKPELVRFETVGPILSQEILEKTYVALAIAAVGILFWIAWQFKSIQFGISAIVATIHDTTILLGTFSALGHYKNVEVDILFVTALLTILSFSVHDTIVVYDRIRESSKRLKDKNILTLANKAVGDTIIRSFNNSITIIFMLIALFLMGGATIKWFVFALLIGTISGTYSSPFVAVPLLVTWEQIRRSYAKIV